MFLCEYRCDIFNIQDFLCIYCQWLTVWFDGTYNWQMLLHYVCVCVFFHLCVCACMHAFMQACMHECKHTWWWHVKYMLACTHARPHPHICTQCMSSSSCACSRDIINVRLFTLWCLSVYFPQDHWLAYTNGYRLQLWRHSLIPPTGAVFLHSWCFNSKCNLPALVTHETFDVFALYTQQTWKLIKKRKALARLCGSWHSRHVGRFLIGFTSCICLSASADLK